MSNLEQQIITTKNVNQKRAGIWLTGLFAVLSLTFLLFALYNSLVSQEGFFDLVDIIVIANSSVLLIASGIGWWLVQKNRFQTGAGIVIVANLLLGIGITFTVRSAASLVASYIVLTSLLLIYLVFPRNSRAIWFVIMVFGLICTAIVEFLNPSFRIQSLIILGIAPYVNALLILIILVLLAVVVRQAIVGNVRTRLIVSFILIALIPVTVVTVATSFRSFSTQVPQALEIQGQVAKLAAQQVETFIRDRENEIRALSDVGDLTNLTLDEQTNLITSLFSSQDLYREIVLTNSQGEELIHVSRTEIFTKENLNSRANSPEFDIPEQTGDTYFGDVTFDDETGEPFMLISVPLFDLRTGELANVVIANFRFKTVWDIMAKADVIGSGIVYMIDKQHRVVAHSNPSVVAQATQVDLPAENDFTIGLNNTEVAMAREPISLNWQTFSVIAEQPRSEALSLAQSNFLITVAISAGMLVLAAGLGTIAAQRITDPIDQLATIAQNISKGDLSLQADIKSEDEIGLMATAFNSMTSQLKDLIGSLEQRVAERTAELEASSIQIRQRASQLETIADVASSVASLKDVDQLLPEISKTISERFGFYHVGIFLLSKDKEFAVLQAANSEGGQKMLERKHQLRVGQEGIVGFAIDQKKARIALDVGDDAVFFNNPDLRATRSEMALPLILSTEVIGALDVQSDQPNAFSNEDIEVLSTMANQVTVAIENSRLFAQSQQTLAELEKTFQRYIQNEWGQYSSISEIKGYRAYDAGLEPITEGQQITAKNGSAHKSPIKLRGVTIGYLDIDLGKSPDDYSQEEIDIIHATTERVALALESARLLETSQRQAAKEQRISDITAKIGASVNMHNVLQTAVEELGKSIPGSEIVIQFQSKLEKAQGEQV